jgi:hypothetical protein
VKGEEGESQLLDAVTVRLVMTLNEETCLCLTMILKVYSQLDCLRVQ